MHRLFVGLGNPGNKYLNTRHNIGFMVLQALSKDLGWNFKENKYCQAWVAKGELQDQKVHLLMPLTFMNESGVAVRRYMDDVGIPLQDLLVVVDDIALPLGQFRLRNLGSAGGHNGLKSIEAHLKTKDYARLRMGIGHQGQDNLADYVLDPFTSDEQKVLPEYIQKGTEVIRLLVNRDIAEVMKTVNNVNFGVSGLYQDK